MVGTKTPRTPAALDAAAAVVDRLEAGAGQMRDPCAVKPGLPPVVGSATDHGRGPLSLQPNNWMLVVETGWRGSLYGGPGA
jgi:hypothetical protein